MLEDGLIGALVCGSIGNEVKESSDLELVSGPPGLEDIDWRKLLSRLPRVMRTLDIVFGFGVSRTVCELYLNEGEGDASQSVYKYVS